MYKVIRQNLICKQSLGLNMKKNILEYSSYFCIENNIMFYKLT